MRHIALLLLCFVVANPANAGRKCNFKDGCSVRKVRLQINKPAPVCCPIVTTSSTGPVCYEGESSIPLGEPAVAEVPKEVITIETVIDEVPAAPTPASPSDMADSGAYAKPGFFTELKDSRLWVLLEGSEELEQYKSSGEPAKNVTLVDEGPDGITIRSSDRDVIVNYLTSKPGYYTEVKEGRLWVFEEGSDGLKEFRATGEPAKNVAIIGEGPLGMTIRSSDRDTIDKYMAK